MSARTGWLAAAVAAGALASAGGDSALPPADKQGRMTLEAALEARRSVRRFAARALTAGEIGQLCWAAQGVTSPRGFRAAPSAGATFPLELYVADAKGLWRYDPGRHALEAARQGDVRPALQEAALNQTCVGQAPAVFIIAADASRTARRYGARAQRYVLIEVGHASQNLLLQAVALGLGGVAVGAFDDAKLNQALALPKGVEPLYLLPVGEPAK
ncbi:MAG TPA: SagB/ThcOx family dehydrogenase [Candidatus Brocadiia bacterium]|nr:SagB/ThcOx family dehydrogenase [Candidatus Brocadiia bacterium]